MNFTVHLESQKKDFDRANTLLYNKYISVGRKARFVPMNARKVYGEI
jgi:hypothetical protein